MTNAGNDKPLDQPEGEAPRPEGEQPPITASTPDVDIARYVAENTPVNPSTQGPQSPDYEITETDARAARGDFGPDEPARQDPPVLSYIDEEDEGGGDYGRNEDAVERNRRRRAAMAKVAALLGVLLLLGAGGFILFGGGDDASETGSSSDRQAGGQLAAAATPTRTATSAAAATPTATASTAPTATAIATATPTSAPAPSGARPRTNQQLTSSNFSAADAAALFGACAHESTTQNGTDVTQAVSSSQPMVAAMNSAGFAGVRNAYRAPTPCQGLPYNVASVMGNANSLSNAEALFDAAALNYGQVLFTNVAPFSLGGPWDESHCQSGVYPPSGNIIAVACWVREDIFVGGSFVLLPPGSSQAVISAAINGTTAFWQRVIAIVQ